MSRLIVLGLLALVGCGAASSPPKSRESVPKDELAGCWRDPEQGLIFCLEERGYVLFLPDGKWDRVIVDWAEKTPTKRSGRTRTPRPLWLSVRAEGGALVMDDGESQSRLARPAAAEQTRLSQRIARLPELSEVCDRAEQCKQAAGAVLGASLDRKDGDLMTGRACLGYLNAIAAVLREAGQALPPECVQ